MGWDGGILRESMQKKHTRPLITGRSKEIGEKKLELFNDFLNSI